MLELPRFLGQHEHYRLMRQGFAFFFLCSTSSLFLFQYRSRPVTVPIDYSLGLDNKGCRASHHSGSRNDPTVSLQGRKFFLS